MIVTYVYYICLSHMHLSDVCKISLSYKYKYNIYIVDGSDQHNSIFFSPECPKILGRYKALDCLLLSFLLNPFQFLLIMPQ